MIGVSPCAQHFVAAIILPLYLYFTGQQPKMQAGKIKNFQMDFV